MFGRFVVALASTAVAVVALSCGDDAAPARTALTPIATAEVPNAVDLGTVASRSAIESARQIVLSAESDLGAATMPAEPVARLTSAGAVSSWAGERERIDADFAAVQPDALVWAVQLQGQWRPSRDSATPGAARFAVVAIDARTGDAVAGVVSPDPFIAPRTLRDKNTFDCVAFEPAEARLALGPQQATEAVRAIYPAGATNKFGGDWDFDRADADPVRCVQAAGGMDQFRFRWFVTVPSRLSLHDCSTPSGRAVDLKRRCWSPVAVHLVDGVTGNVEKRREIEFNGPLLTDQQFEETKQLAALAGWWEVWGRLSAFNDSIVPTSALTSPARP